MAAITWQNVNAPSNGDANRLMFLGQNTINQGFDKFNEIIKGEEARSNANWDAQAKNNTNAYMDALAEAKTPEEFQSKQAFLAQMRQGFQAQGDIAAMRKAENEQLAVLQNRATANIGYKAALDNEADIAKTGAATEAMTKGEYTRANEIIGSMSPRNQAAWFQKMEANKDKDTAQARENIKFGFDEAKAKREAELFPGEQTAQRIKNENAVLAGKLTAAQIKETEADAAATGGKSLKKMAFEQEQATKIYTAAKANSEYGSGYLGSSEGDKAFLEAGMKMKLEDKDRASISEAKARLEKKLGIPIPVSIANEALYYSADTSWFGSSNRGKAFESAVLAKMGAPEQLQKYADEFKKYSELTSNYQATIAGINGVTPTGNVGSSPAPAIGKSTKQEASTTPPSVPDASGSSWSLSKFPTGGPYANAGPAGSVPSEVPFGGSITDIASKTAAFVDVLRGSKNARALGKEFNGYEQAVNSYFAKAEEEAKAKKAKGK